LGRLETQDVARIRESAPARHQNMKDDSYKRVCLLEKKPQIRAMLEAALRFYNVSASYFSKPQECLQELAERPCDLFIVDLDDWEVEGLHALAQVRRMAPWTSSLAVVERAGVRCAVRAMKAGANDCLEKPVQRDRLTVAIERHLSHAQASGGRSRKALTQTEIQVLQLILAGRTSRDIAIELHRSKRTIDVHRKNIMRKLEASSPVDLVRRAMGMGFSQSQ
jgi:FixJ family two-component response regulator